jgi:hypothetical protein
MAEGKIMEVRLMATQNAETKNPIEQFGWDTTLLKEMGRVTEEIVKKIATTPGYGKVDMVNEIAPLSLPLEAKIVLAAAIQRRADELEMTMKMGELVLKLL